MKETDGAVNALTRVVTREDNGVCRTALQLTDNAVNSVDVLFPSGKLMCRLHIAANEDNGWGNVDVEYSPCILLKKRGKGGK